MVSSIQTVMPGRLINLPGLSHQFSYLNENSG